MTHVDHPATRSPSAGVSDPDPLAGSAAIRETIDLLELDLRVMVGAVARAAETLLRGTVASAQAFDDIRGQTGALAAKTRDATNIVSDFRTAYKL